MVHTIVQLLYYFYNTTAVRGCAASFIRIFLNWSTKEIFPFVVHQVRKIKVYLDIERILQLLFLQIVGRKIKT